MRAVMCAVTCTVVSAGAGWAQAVPEGSQAMRVDMGFRRSPLEAVDPFRNVMLPRWGLVFSGGASAHNNAFSLQDAGALMVLDRDDRIEYSDWINLITLVPKGEGFRAAVEGEASSYLGMSFGRGLTLGFSAGARSYGSMFADDALVSFFRDGNVGNPTLSFGTSNALALTTADVGAHAVMRFGPLGSIDGVHVSAGLGGRMVRPVFLVNARSSVTGGGSFSITSDSIRGNVGVEILSSFPLDSTDNLSTYIRDRANGSVGGGGVVGDLLLRLDWPTSGISLEGMLVNLGSALTMEQVGRGSDTLLILTTSIDSLDAALNRLDFNIQDSTNVTVALPQIWRVGASAWANTILQLDVSATGSFSGDVEVPMSVALGSTWRFLRHFPLRAGMILGGSQGIGFAGGVGIESRHFLLRFNAQSLGGLFHNATGVGGRFDFGLFF